MEGPDAGRLQKCSRVKTRQLVTSWRQQQAERFGLPGFFFSTQFNQMSGFSDVKCVGMIFFLWPFPFRYTDRPAVPRSRSTGKKVAEALSRFRRHG